MSMGDEDLNPFTEGLTHTNTSSPKSYTLICLVTFSVRSSSVGLPNRDETSLMIVSSFLLPESYYDTISVRPEVSSPGPLVVF